jgi:hypothetical protein
MKNIITIDLDTEREQTLIINKPKEFIEGVTDGEKAKQMISDDLSTLCNAIGVLINNSEKSGYFKKGDLSKLCIKYFNDNFK